LPARAHLTVDLAGLRYLEHPPQLLICGGRGGWRGGGWVFFGQKIKERQPIPNNPMINHYKQTSTQKQNQRQNGTTATLDYT